MSLRTRTCLTIGTTFLSLIILLYITSRVVLLSSYEDLEQQHLHQDLERVTSGLNNVIASLDTFNHDWAAWDDTYAFIEEVDEEYIAENLLDQTFIDAQLNLMLFLDPAGHIVFGKTFDVEHEASTPLPAELEEYLASTSLAAHSDQDSVIVGVIAWPAEGTMMISSRPITTSNGEAPIRGTLIMGRFLNEQMVHHLADTTQLSLTIERLDNPHLLANFQFAELSLSRNSTVVTDVQDADTIAGYTYVQDVHGDPLLIVRVEVSRDIYAQGQASLYHFVIMLILISIISTGVVLLLLERSVLSRLLGISQAVSQIQDTGDFTLPIPVHGNDELADLGKNITSMLASIGYYQGRLHAANDALESQVNLRTRQLSETIDQLEMEVIERKQAQDALAQARDQALDALRLKSQILANISHDARTPLTIISLNTQFLQRYESWDEKHGEKLSSILMCTDQLTEFFNNLVTEAQHDARAILVQPRPFTANELLTDALAPMHRLADRKQLALKTVIDPHVPQPLWGDVERLKQIVSNLVGNALRFTERGSVEVLLFMPDNKHWALAVSDTGRGIKPDDLTHVFKAFWQVDGSITRDVNRGIGLGLSVVKALTESMEGHINLESEFGIGSTVTVTFPLIEQPEEMIRA